MSNIGTRQKLKFPYLKVSTCNQPSLTLGHCESSPSSLISAGQHFKHNQREGQVDNLHFEWNSNDEQSITNNPILVSHESNDKDWDSSIQRRIENQEEIPLVNKEIPLFEINGNNKKGTKSKMARVEQPSVSEQQDDCSNKKQKLNEGELEGRITLAAQQISSSTSMELEETPLMDLSQRVIGGAPSLDDDDKDGY
ncbi:hypothetical protein LIER_20867 [Lithospermum erythrorhizon]|uniref:Uncharacterized protein n=1 Tax=Lithospermum erythrorhizon TaxID=34254 RepID=A0AAV3QR29_LITER